MMSLKNSTTEGTENTEKIQYGFQFLSVPSVISVVKYSKSWEALQ